MDMSQYRTLFLTEAREYLQEIGRCVVELEASPEGRAEIDELFRAAHSLKGMAASMDYPEIVTLAHYMEDLMSRVRGESIPFDHGIADLLLEGADLLEGMLEDLEGNRELRGSGDLPGRLAAYRGETVPTTVSATAVTPAFELVYEPEPEGEPRGEREPEPEPETANAPSREPATVRVSSELLDRLVNLTGELITNKQRLLNLGRFLASPRLDEALSETTRLLRGLQDEVTTARLMPFGTICGRLERSVRDVARKSGKEVRLEVEGREIGLDRGVLEQLGEPLNHLLRNAVDHGLEPAAKRLGAGKPESGEVRLSVVRDRHQIVVTVTDDGRGMDPDAMVASAVAKGLITPDEGALLSPRQALMLCVIPGFSTAGTVTEISGRGVGMDAVNAAIHKLGGSLTIDSKPGEGSRFTLRLPMTIAIVHALLVRCGRFKGAVPVSAVHRSVELRRDQIRSEGERRVFYLDEEPIPLLSLNRMLGEPSGPFPHGFIPLFVTELKGRQVGLVVDELLGQYELFIKSLGRPLAKLRGVAGGAILGDGEIVPVLDLPNLL